MAWNYFGLKETMRVDEIVDDDRQIREAALTSFALMAPKQIEAEGAKLRARITRHNRRADHASASADGQSREELLAFAARMNEAMEKGRVFSDEPPGGEA